MLDKFYEVGWDFSNVKNDLTELENNDEARDLAKAIKKGDDALPPKGSRTERLTDIVFEREGYIKAPSQFGSNNGFDGVYIKWNSGCVMPFASGCVIEDVIIAEAKPMTLDGVIILNKENLNTDLPAQMTDEWIKNVLNRMDNSDSESISILHEALIDFLNQGGKISKVVTAIDKKTGEFNIINLGIYP